MDSMRKSMYLCFAHFVQYVGFLIVCTQVYGQDRSLLIYLILSYLGMSYKLLNSVVLCPWEFWGGMKTWERPAKWNKLQFGKLLWNVNQSKGCLWKTCHFGLPWAPAAGGSAVCPVLTVLSVRAAWGSLVIWETEEGEALFFFFF